MTDSRSDGVGLSRLVNISNRVPAKGVITPGGLAVGVLAAMRRSGGLWFGWDGQIRSGGVPEPEVTVRDGIAYATMPLPPDLHEHYYSGFANGALWPLFHYFLAGFRYQDHEYAAYQEANGLFARSVLPLLRPSDLVWVHDYQLIPLGQRLRELGAGQRLGFFLHIPFPQFETLRALPVFAELVQALFAYDLVGFQTETDRRSFLEAVRGLRRPDIQCTDEWVILHNRRVSIGVFPISVDTNGVAQSAAKAAESPPVQRMVQGLLGRRLIMGVDRLDHTKGLLERFRAYSYFLEHFSEHTGRVTFLQIAPLGRQNVRAYQEIRQALERSSGRTNGRFADTDWTPIRYLNRNFPHATLMGFLRNANVCLVTPLRDGMNLVAKEFIAAQNADDPGVLILSDRAGAACELRDALLVNPYDTREIACALQTALAMPLAERRERHQKLLATLRAQDIHHWYSSFLERLASGDIHPVRVRTRAESLR